MDVLVDVVGMVLSFIGVVATVCYLHDRFFPYRRISWRYAEKAVERMTTRMIIDDFAPTLIVGIGRGGAVMGALVSGCFGHKPLVVIDRQYKWVNGERDEDMICSLDIASDYLKNVLIIAGGVYAGNTMKKYTDYFKKKGVAKIKRAALLYEVGAITDIEYKGFSTTRKNIKLPWMSRNYLRDDRYQKRADNDTK